jgi:hypothetical protein
MTDRQESTVVVLLMSNIKSGFLIKFTQNLNGRLKKKAHFIHMICLIGERKHPVSTNDSQQQWVTMI